MKTKVPIIFSAFLLTAGCGFFEGFQDGMEDGREDAEANETHEINLDPTIDINDDEITIEGETNFDDGSVFLYNVTNLEEPDEVIEGDTEAEGGEVNETVDIEEFNEGNIQVLFSWQAVHQSDELQEKYGESGEFVAHAQLDEEVGEIVFEEKTEIN